jgi:phosphatidate phosphatase PAH1
MRSQIIALSLLLVSACSFDVGPDPGTSEDPDAGQPDTALLDASSDAGSEDAGADLDAAVDDAGEAVEDGGSDAGEIDGGVSDGGEVADAGPECDRRTSSEQWHPCRGDGFVPDTPTEAWRHTTTSIFVVTQGAARHRGIDTIVNPGQDPVLIGKFAYGIFDKDLVDERVEIWIEESCGNWVRHGEAFTSDDGQNATVNGVEDDGGRVFFQPTRRLPVGSYRVKMLVKGDHSEANFWLHVLERGTRAVVSDIDGTITTRETDGAWTALDPSSPTPRDGAADVFRVYAAKGYRVVFLTARPEFLTNGTRTWFSDHSFPEAVFHLSQSNFGESGAQAQAYKAGFLSSIVEGQGITIDWAYGNKETDLDAYLGTGVQADHIRLVAGEYSGDLKGSVMIDGYVPEIDRVACLPPVEALTP